MGSNSNNSKAVLNNLKGRASTLNVLDQSGGVLRGQQIWTDKAPSLKNYPNKMFVKCNVMAGSGKTKLVCTEADSDNKEKFEIAISDAWNCNTQLDPLSCGDIGLIPHRQVPCVLDFLNQRYLKDYIYTTAEPLLVAINPYKDLKNTTQKWIEKYKNSTSNSKLPPHIFSVANDSLRNYFDVDKSQTIIVSGESGSGKTEATKQIMRYFASTSAKDRATHIQDAIMAANPVIEAFGNAKTVRNDNSSRFGRFMKLDIKNSGGILHGYVIAFLLEKSRVVTQDKNERGYHIFYQLLKGASEEDKKAYHILNPDEYKYINPKCLSVDGIDDVADYNVVIESLQTMDISNEYINYIKSILSGILLLGNVKVSGVEKDGIDDAADILGDDLKTFKLACSLLYVDDVLLLEELTVKKAMAGKTEIISPWSKEKGEVLKSSVSRAFYERLFLYLIEALNTTITQPNLPKFLGMLDIFGFEIFEQNSLEQLFINVTNEWLQKNFVSIVFEREQRLYQEEGIGQAKLEYTSNDKIIELLIGKGNSVFSYLEDQCLGPSGSDQKLVSNMNMNFKENDAYGNSKNSSNEFVINHSIGPVKYNVQGFIYKNKDVITYDLVELIKSSSNPLTSKICQGLNPEKGKIGKKQLTATNYSYQLRELMDLINSTEPHFIRCVKPNDEKKPHLFDEVKVTKQLHALSIFEALNLKQLGFSYRRPFDEFLHQFKFLDLGTTQCADGDYKNATSKILSGVGLNSADYRIGKTMVFLSSDSVKKLTVMQQERLIAWTPLVDFLHAAVIRYSYSKEFKSYVPLIIRIQAHARKVIEC